MDLLSGSVVFEDSWTNLCSDLDDIGSVSNGDPDSQDNESPCSSRKKDNVSLRIFPTFLTFQARTTVDAEPNHQDENGGSNEDHSQEGKFNIQAAIHEKNFKSQKSYEKRGMIKM